ncbi:hypothetical protein D3C76_1512620 [compost metagenome]
MIPVTINAPCMPINHSKLQITIEIIRAVSVSEAMMSGRKASLIMSGKIMPVFCFRSALTRVIESMMARRGIRSWKPLRVITGTSSGRRIHQPRR